MEDKYQKPCSKGVTEVNLDSEAQYSRARLTTVKNPSTNTNHISCNGNRKVKKSDKGSKLSYLNAF